MSVDTLIKGAGVVVPAEPMARETLAASLLLPTAGTEVRWFMPGSGPHDRGRRHERLDRYDSVTLSPTRSLKRRGAKGTLELKLRVGRVERFELNGVVGFAEQWVKRRIAEDAVGIVEDAVGDVGEWIPIRKCIWYEAGLEIGRVQIDGERDRWWTVALDPSRRLKRSTVRWLREHRGELASGMPASFAGWIDACAHTGR